MNINNELIQYFLYKKVIKKKDVDEILEECENKQVPVDAYLVQQGLCTEAFATSVLGEYYCLPSIEVDMLDIDKELLENFSYIFMKKNKFLPVSINRKGVLLVAIGRPLDFDAVSMLATYYSGPIDYVLVPPTQIDVYIDSIVAVISTAQALEELKKSNDQKKDTAVLSESENDVINNPAVRLVDSIIKEAIPFRASDIHIEPFDKIVKVRYRIDGDLRDRASFPIESYPAIGARIKILAGLNIAERRVPQDGRINLTINEKSYDFRVSSLPTVYGEKFVIRILDKSSFSFSRQDLGFSEESNAIVDKILEHPHGIVLLTGPTGCGKSTTLYSFLRELNSPEVNIVTVEDPVEYTMMGINQTQINNKANMTFAAALRSILRQDPDIIMIGEIRDEETADIAIRAAITGHLVFSTLHTNDAPGAINRLVDMGVDDYLVADALVGVIAQRLVKRLCPACKKKGKTTPAEMKLLGLDEPISIFKPQGCQFCNNSGYRGRIGIHEILYVNEEIRAAVVEKKPIGEIRKYARENGMVTLNEACRDLVIKGVTSVQELMTIGFD